MNKKPAINTIVFLDTEFTGLHKYAQLISIGLVAENGSMFYGEVTDWDRTETHPWLEENVLPHLSGNLRSASNAKVQAQMFVRGESVTLSRCLRNWFAQFGGENSVIIWADVLAWDWVLFCDLFGGAFGLPPQIHYIPRDLSTLLVLKGYDPDVERETLGRVTFHHPDLHLRKHHALYDALLEMDVFNSLEI